MMLINTHEILTLNVFIIDKTKNNSKYFPLKKEKRVNQICFSSVMYQYKILNLTSQLSTFKNS